MDKKNLSIDYNKVFIEKGGGFLTIFVRFHSPFSDFCYFFCTLFIKFIYIIFLGV